MAPSTTPPLSLAQRPTPVHRLERMSAALDLDLWVKRDDLTGFGLSGNKVRKLEYLLADAVARGCDTVLTTGGLQSNHCRATAVACRQRGLRPVLLLRGELPDVPDSNLLLDRLLGAEIHTCTPEDYRHRRDELLAQLAEDARRRGHVPYVIGEGGSNGLGAMGFVTAGEELAAQAEGFDGIVIAVGSGGTLAGLAMAPTGAKVIGVPVCDDAAYFRPKVHQICEEAQRHGAPPLPPEGRHWAMWDGYQGPAYAVATPDIWSTIARVAQLEGLLLDPVYTGKAMHALCTEAAAQRIRGRWLFWHTGGAFGMFGRGQELPS